MEIQKKNKIQIGEEGEKGEGVYLAVHWANLSPAWEKRAEPGGDVSPGLGQGGAMARPLDGGTLTHWGARTPVRGPAMVPWLYRHRSLSLGVDSA